MREFMHHITNNFFASTGWSEDNSYRDLNATSRVRILSDSGSRDRTNCPVAQSLSISPCPEAFGYPSPLLQHRTSPPATTLAPSVSSTVPSSYLYSSLPLSGTVAKSENIPLPALLRSYRNLHDLSSREHWPPTVYNGGADIEKSDALTELKKGLPGCGTTPNRYNSTLLYGRLYLPLSMLEGLVVKRLGPSLQVQLSAVSAQSLRDGGTLLGLVQYDKGRYGVEGLASTDGGFLGIRGLHTTWWRRISGNRRSSAKDRRGELAYRRKR